MVAAVAPSKIILLIAAAIDANSGGRPVDYHHRADVVFFVVTMPTHPQHLQASTCARWNAKHEPEKQARAPLLWPYDFSAML